MLNKILNYISENPTRAIMIFLLAMFLLFGFGRCVIQCTISNHTLSEKCKFIDEQQCIYKGPHYSPYGEQDQYQCPTQIIMIPRGACQK